MRSATRIRAQLPATEAERLNALFCSTDDRKLRDRLQIVRMAHRGHARQDIAADLAIPRKTVTGWINAYCDAGIDGLRPKKAEGKVGNIPRELVDEVKRWVIEGPTTQGLDRADRIRTCDLLVPKHYLAKSATWHKHAMRGNT